VGENDGSVEAEAEVVEGEEDGDLLEEYYLTQDAWLFLAVSAVLASSKRALMRLGTSAISNRAKFNFSNF